MSTEQQQETVQIDTNQGGDNEPAYTGLGYILIKRHMRFDPISIVFAVLIFIGGLIGYFTKGSLPSLIAGIVFFVLLAIGTYIEGALKNPWPLLVVLGALSAMMSYRYFSSMNFMPSGLIAVLSIIMLLRHGYLFHLRRQASS